jgi:hypothetical protein
MSIHTNEDHSNIISKLIHISILNLTKKKHVTLLIGLIMTTFCYPCLRITKKIRNHMYSKKDYFEFISHMLNTSFLLHMIHMKYILKNILHIKNKNYKTTFQLPF